MQCVNPNNYTRHGILNPHIPPCGKCLSCRLSKQSEWASRLLLESKSHDSATFWTATYSNEHLPSELSKPDMQKFIKRWRFDFGQPRYFLCGEYGDLFKRPHYHGVFFGDKPEYTWRKSTHANIQQIVKLDPRFEDTWKKGITYVKASSGSVQTKNIMQYVAAYVVKKNLKPQDKPEWALMSRSPYIGFSSVNAISEALTTRKGSAHLAVVGTCPNFFRMAGRRFMIPLRIRKEVCENIGIEFRPYEATENTIEVDIDGQKTLKARSNPKKNYREAEAWARSIRNAFKRKENRARSRLDAAQTA